MDGFWILVVASLVAINCGLVGSFLVLRKSTMMADAISHAILPGIVLSYLFFKSLGSVAIIFGATFTGILSMFLISFFNKKAYLQLDASIGVIFTFLFALGVILISYFTKKVDLDQECVLYGEIIHVPLKLLITKNGFSLGPKPFYISLFVLMLNLLFFLVFYKKFYITSFDDQYASSLGINILLWDYILMALTSLTTVAAFDSVGAILVVALISVPTASAYLLTSRLYYMILLACLFGVIISIGGYFFALLFNVPVSGSMSSIAGFLFIISFVINKIQCQQ